MPRCSFRSIPQCGEVLDPDGADFAVARLAWRPGVTLGAMDRLIPGLRALFNVMQLNPCSMFIGGLLNPLQNAFLPKDAEFPKREEGEKKNQGPREK